MVRSDAWWGVAPWQIEQSNRVLRFLGGHLPVVPNQFALDGAPLSEDSSTGRYAMAAAAGLAADPELARPFVEHLWNGPVPNGQWRYYDGLLHFLSLLQVGGRLHVHHPQPGPADPRTRSVLTFPHPGVRRLLHAPLTRVCH